MTEFGENVEWRETQKPAKFGPVDYRAVVFVIPILLYFRFITVIIAFIALAIFWHLEKKKVQPDNVLRWIRATLAGDYRTSHGPVRQRRPVDFGFEDDEHIRIMEARIQKQMSLVAQGKRKGADKMTERDVHHRPRLQGISST